MQMEKANLLDFTLSPKASFICTFEKIVDATQKNVCVWDLQGNLRATFYHKHQNSW